MSSASNWPYAIATVQHASWRVRSGTNTARFIDLQGKTIIHEGGGIGYAHSFPGGLHADEGEIAMGKSDSTALEARARAKAEATERDQKSTESAAVAAEERAKRARLALKKAKKESKKASKAARKARKAAHAASKAAKKAAARIARMKKKVAKDNQRISVPRKTAASTRASKKVTPIAAKRARRASVSRAATRERRAPVEPAAALDADHEGPGADLSDDSDSFLMNRSDLP